MDLIISRIAFRITVIILLISAILYIYTPADTMNRINEFGIEPGVYLNERDERYVVTDVITHIWYGDKCMELHPVYPPLVVVRELVAPAGKHRSEAYQLDEFNKRFKAE